MNDTQLNDTQRPPLMKKIMDNPSAFTPKGRLLGKYVLKHPRKVVFMTTKELAAACQVSEATVVRFVGQLGYGGYGEFLQDLRDVVDSELTLLDRVDLSDMKGPGAGRFQRLVSEEIENLKQLYEAMDLNTAGDLISLIETSPAVYVVGSRISYTFAYFMGWSLTKIRSGVITLKGSDSTTLDHLAIAPPDSLVVLIATSRYPSELIRAAKQVRHLGHTLAVIADSTVCPLIQFSHIHLVAPSRNIPFIGSPTGISCLVNYLVCELAGRNGERLKSHQEKLEQTYRENDIFFNFNM